MNEASRSETSLIQAGATDVGRLGTKPAYRGDSEPARLHSGKHLRERLGGDRHVVGIGVQQALLILHDPNMPLPKDKIAAGELRHAMGQVERRSNRRLEV